MTHSFSQQTNEASIAFEAFTIFRDLGSGRSLRAVAEQLEQSVSLCSRWSRQHSWARRARSFDAELDRKKRLIDLRGVERMRERQIRLSLQLQTLAAIELERLIKAAMSRQDRGDLLTPAEIVKLAEAGSKLERLNRGEPGEILEQQINEGADLSQFSMERIRMLKQMRVEIRAKLVADNVVDTVGETVKTA